MVTEYHDFVLVVASLDAEWSRTPVADGQPYVEAVAQQIEATHQTLGESAEDFANNVAINHAAWLKGNQIVDGPLATPLDSRLFSVQTWFPFGHPDALSLIAVDDIEAAHVVVEVYSKGVEEITTAYCPRMKYYRDLHPVASQLFADVLDIFVPRTPHPEDKPVAPSGEKPKLESQPAQLETPLLILSRLRMSPLLTLGRALTSQSAVLIVIANRLVEALTKLSALTDDPLGVGHHWQTLRVSFLDLQDEEELGILVRGTHFSAMMALVSAVQHLTIADFTGAQPDAAFDLLSCRCSRELLDIQETPADFRNAKHDYLLLPKITKVGDNHLFRWSRSVAAVAPHLSAPGRTSDCGAQVSGWVRLATHVSVMLGHQTDAESVIDGLGFDWSSKAPLGCRMHTLGATDMLTQWCSEKARPDGGILTTEAAKLWSLLIERIGRTKHQGKRRDFTGWSSVVSVPVPDQDFHQMVGENHSPLFHDLMRDLRQIKLPELLDEDKIRTATRIMGLSAPNRRPLIYLAQNFGQVMSNPLLFDVLLDHIDVLETLGNALFNHLEPLLKDEPHAPNYTPRVPQKIVEQLIILISALDDAFELRLRRLYPDTPVRDWSLDMRTQNHQVLLCADAVLKCALAVFRKDVLCLQSERASHDEIPAKLRGWLGVVLRLKFHPGIEGSYLTAFHRLANDKGDHPAPRLGVFEADYPHLRNILNYSHFYHEAAHLIYDELVSKRPAGGLAGLSSPEDLRSRYIPHDHFRNAPGDNQSDYLSYSDTVQEMFVHMVMLLFVFDGDRNLLLMDHLNDLAVSLASAPDGEEHQAVSKDQKHDARVRRFSESVYHALGPIIWLEHALQLDPSEEISGVTLCRSPVGEEQPLHPTIDQFVASAWCRLQSLKGAYPDFDWLFPPEEEKAVDAFRMHMGRLYSWTYSVQVEFWTIARAIFAHHIQRLVQEAEGLDSPAPALVRRALTAEGNAILEGSIAAEYETMQSRVDDLIQSRWLNAENGAFRPVPGNPGDPSLDLICGQAVDANLIIRRSLFHYLKIYRSKGDGGGLALPRCLADEGKVDTEVMKSRPHSTFMIDRTAVDMFCCVPLARRRRVGQEIAFLKTLWDIAARNRARRLVSLKRGVKHRPADDSHSHL